MVTEIVDPPSSTSDDSQLPSLSRYVPADETFSPVLPSLNPSRPRKWRSHAPMSNVTFEPLKPPEITPEMMLGASMPPPGAFIPASLPFAPDNSSSRLTELSGCPRVSSSVDPNSSPNPRASSSSTGLSDGMSRQSPYSEPGQTTMNYTALQAPPPPPPYPGKNPIPEGLREAGLLNFELISFTSDKKSPDCPYHIPLKTDNLVPDNLEDDIDEGARGHNRKLRLRTLAVRYHYHCAVVWGPSDPVPEYAEPGDIWINTGEQKAVWIVNREGEHVRWPGNLFSDHLLSDRFAHPWATDLYLWYGGRSGWNWWSKSRHIDSARLRLAKGVTKFAEWLAVRYQGREDQRSSLGTDVDAVEHWLENKSETTVAAGKKRKADGDRRPNKRSGGEPAHKRNALPNRTAIRPSEGDGQSATTPQYAVNPALLERSPPSPNEQLLMPTCAPAEIIEQVTSAAPKNESMHCPLLQGRPMAGSEGSQSQQDSTSPPPAPASVHILISEPGDAAKTPNATSPGVQFFTIKHKTRTVLARRPKTYQAALDLAHKHFKSLAGKDVYFQTTQVDFAAGEAVELPDDIWEDVVDSLTTVEVLERAEDTAPDAGSAAGLKAYSAPPTPLSPFCC